MPAKPLTLEQKQDAERLKGIYDERKDVLRLSQEMLADEFGFSAQGAVNQYLTGRIPLNVKTAVKFAEHLRCRVSDFSPSIQREIDRLSRYASESVEPCDMSNEGEQYLMMLRSLSPDERSTAMNVLAVLVDSWRKQRKRPRKKKGSGADSHDPDQ
ncbi:MAG: helix-turn-helix domain-containing protein [Betaproteobacteria bacterium]|nr:helix-turn-helix domain-containing protein [Betaproteobacteria bacterium]